jgi:hypothetical protein
MSSEIADGIRDRVPDVQIEEQMLPSGACWIDVRYRETMVTVECSLALGFGVSVVERDSSFEGHDRVFIRAEDVIGYVTSLLLRQST